jgi:hypothetical protein
MIELRDRLRQRLNDTESTPQDISECVHLLLQLNEPVDSLCDDYLSTSKFKLQSSLDNLTRQVEVATNSNIDVLEFVDQGCNGFLSDLYLVIASFNETFNADEDILASKLNEFVLGLMEEFMALLR